MNESKNLLNEDLLLKGLELKLKYSDGADNAVDWSNRKGVLLSKNDVRNIIHFIKLGKKGLEILNDVFLELDSIWESDPSNNVFKHLDVNLQAELLKEAKWI